MTEFTNRLFNYWLPEKNRNGGISDVRLIVFIRVAFIFLGMGVAGMVITFLVTSDSNISFYHQLSATGSVLIGTLMLVLIKKTGKPELVFNIVTVLGLCALALPVFQAGGIYSSNVWWITIFPVTAFFLISKRTGILWTVVSLCFVTTVLVLYIYQGRPEFVLDNPFRRVLDMALIIIYISSILYIYEKNRDKLILKMREAHYELKKQNLSLIELNRENETLMAIVAHDLKAPQHQLQMIIRLMQMEFKEKNLPEEYINLANKIITGSLHMINDITYTKAISERPLLQTKEPLYPWEFISMTCDEFEAGAKEKNITIVKELQHSDKMLNIDKNILSRILQNLISNAIKFSPFDKNIFVKLSLENNQWVIGIKDEGPGIDKKEQKLLFKRFQKLSARPTNKETSSGLGLYIVKMLIGKVGGNIELISETGQGAEFRVMLPAN